MGHARASAGQINLDYDLDDLLTAVTTGKVAAAAQTGRRSRRRLARDAATSAGAVAAILGLEGCVPIVRDPDMTAPPGPRPPSTPEPAPGAPDPADPTYAVPESGVVEVKAADLLAEIPRAKSLVKVTGAEHGTVQVKGALVLFTPNEGYEGPAVINFTYKDSKGKTQTGRFEFNVDQPAHEGHGGDGGSDPGGHGGHDDGGVPHQDDPAKQKEHLALMALVPVSEATHVAVKDGSWFDPSTWANGQVPGNGAKVVIPEGVTVEYDGESAVSLFTVRVDGEMNFATDKDTFMEVDTFVVTPTGHLTIGTADHPVAAGVEAVISIAKNGPIDVEWDPMLLSRGVISHGAIEIHGAEKENFIRLAVDPMKGQTTLVLEAPPDGWRVGDKLVLTGTHLTAQGSAAEGQPRLDAKTEDEELIIVAINGNTITVDHALQYNHEGARADLKAYVANYTRNVRIETEGGDAVPVHERGHVMFMHSDNIDVRYAEFNELGRTDKSERSFDVNTLANVESDSNIQGRYSLHIHRAGVSDPTDPVNIVGNAVWGSPGWGFVHHDSNAILAGNAAYDVFGAAFVAETGNETGRWVDNISIKTIGVNVGPKQLEDLQAFDQGRNGVGFWFQGRLVDAADNVAAGSPGGHGFVYQSRVTQAQPEIDANNVLQGEKLRYLDQEYNYTHLPNLGQFAGNESIATFHGLEIVKPEPRQSNDVRSIIEDFTAWEVWNGVLLQYTGHYTLKDLDLVGTDSNIPRRETSIGLWYGNNTFDTTVVNADIHGFSRGVTLQHSNTMTGITPSEYRYVFVDVDVAGNGVTYEGLNQYDQVLSGSSLVNRVVTYDSDLPTIITSPLTQNDPPIILYGHKTDSVGTTETSTTWDPFQISFYSVRGAVEQNGYWQAPDGRFVTLIEEYVADRATGEMEKFAIWVALPPTLNMTANAQPWTGVRTVPEFHGDLDFNNAAPTAHNDTAKVDAGESIIIDVLANDSDPDSSNIKLDSLIGADHGHVVMKDGKVTYFADPDFHGQDTFTYWVADDQGNFDKAQVTITVEI